MVNAIDTNLEIDLLTSKLEVELKDRYGQLIPGKYLWKELGFSSQSAMQRSISRGLAGVATFAIENRQGRFALTGDVARWLAVQRWNAS